MNSLFKFEISIIVLLLILFGCSDSNKNIDNNENDDNNKQTINTITYYSYEETLTGVLLAVYQQDKYIVLQVYDTQYADKTTDYVCTDFNNFTLTDETYVYYLGNKASIYRVNDFTIDEIKLRDLTEGSNILLYLDENDCEIVLEFPTTE